MNKSDLYPVCLLTITYILWQKIQSWSKDAVCVSRNLQALVKGITLRRTKSSKVDGRTVVNLPDRRVFVQHVTLSDEEKEEYEQATTEGRNIIGRWARFYR